ncbi:MAG: GGDEF-domain containing protein [Gammaproteobacteria bacterium]|nr:MAG: GGDEF-domain containing protein [Gammaproteobacteria bacterium]
MAHLSVPIWVFDVENTRFLWANKSGLAFWNAESLDELRSRDLSDTSRSALNRLQQILRECNESQCSVEERWTLFPEGESTATDVVLSPVVCVDGHTALLVHVKFFDQKECASASAHSTQALLHTSAMISLYDTDLSLLYANPAARSVANHTNEPLNERIRDRQDLEHILLKLEQNGEYDTEVVVNTRNGEAWHHMVFEETANAHTGGRSILCSATDVTQRRLMQQEANRLAYTDDLTGLANRVSLVQQLKTRCCHPAPFSLLFMDLNRFKLINDTLGHSVGDSLLINVASRLRKHTDGSELFVARLGGDEFVLVLDEIIERDALEEYCNALLERLGKPYHVDDHRLHVVPSLGICRYPIDGSTVSTLLRNADLAMYKAKNSNSGRCFFEPSMNTGIADRLALENDLVDAVKLAQFEVFYQPRIDTASLEVICMEALMRWRHPTRGLVSPGAFIPVAEETGLIIEMGRFVLENAMRQQLHWQRNGHSVRISVNISPVQFNSPNLIDTINQVQSAVGCDPGNIELEITESMLLGNNDVSSILTSLHDAGYHLAIDDFGTGYSNLAYLQRYPISSLKIDRSFMINTDQMVIASMILQMGRMLGLNVVAEGVETAEQVAWLKDNKCDEMQGFHFAKPMSPTDCDRFLERWSNQHPLGHAA